MHTKNATRHRSPVGRILCTAAASAALCLGLAGCDAIKDGEMDYRDIPTAKARRGPLTITVTKGGTLQARESLVIKSEVDGSHAILFVVPEGTIITDEDVEEGRVLVELDVTDFAERETNQDISAKEAEAAFTQATENLAIQEKDNESNIAAAELAVKFARMELERYLGVKLAKVVMENKDSVDFSTLAQNEADLKGGQAEVDLKSKQNAVDLADGSIRAPRKD